MRIFLIIIWLLATTHCLANDARRGTPGQHAYLGVLFGQAIGQAAQGRFQPAQGIGGNLELAAALVQLGGVVGRGIVGRAILVMLQAGGGKGCG